MYSCILLLHDDWNAAEGRENVTDCDGRRFAQGEKGKRKWKQKRNEIKISFYINGSRRKEGREGGKKVESDQSTRQSGWGMATKGETGQDGYCSRPGKTERTVSFGWIIASLLFKTFFFLLSFLFY